jgi:hypothetical protein
MNPWDVEIASIYSRVDSVAEITLIS